MYSVIDLRQITTTPGRVDVPRHRRRRQGQLRRAASSAEHEQQQEARDHGLPQRRHSREKQPVLKKPQRMTPKAVPSRLIRRRHCGPAEHDRSHRFERERGADRHLHITISRDIEARSEPAQAPLMTKAATWTLRTPMPASRALASELPMARRCAPNGVRPNGDKDGAVGERNDEHETARPKCAPTRLVRPTGDQRAMNRRAPERSRRDRRRKGRASPRSRECGQKPRRRR